MSAVDTVKTRRRIADALPKTATTEQLVKIAEILGVELAYVPEPSRPYFGPDQVRYVCELRVGSTYRAIYAEGPSQFFTVVKEPFSRGRRINDWWLKVRYLETDHEYNMSLEDHSIFPYDYETWNATNYLTFTDDSRHLKHPECCCHHHCPDGHSHDHHHRY